MKLLMFENVNQEVQGLTPHLIGCREITLVLGADPLGSRSGADWELIGSGSILTF